MASIFLRLPSPHGLKPLTEAWLQPIATYDSDLRIFPSQTRKVYRLARLARQSGGLNASLFKDNEKLPPDTKLAIKLHLVLLPFDLPPRVWSADASHVVATLRRRDQWRFKDGDAAADALDQAEALAEAQADAKWKDDARVRHRAARVGLQYRTGARISLVSPLRRPHVAASVDRPSSTSAATDAVGRDGGKVAVTHGS